MAGQRTGVVHGRLRENEPMARHTSWRVGGPADRYYTPSSIDDLRQFLASLPADEPIFWVGLGSNLLVRDGGVRGTVICTHGVLAGLERLADGSVRAEAGVPCAKLARQCVRWGLGSAEFFAGIPGTVGGALAMNAGAFGGETWSHVLFVETVDRQGVLHRRDKDAYDISYRSVRGPGEEWFLAATFRFREDAKASTADIKALLARRKASQPIGLPSCGSVFRNPPGDHAARLIESAGLKGRRIGGAEVSEKHANFIINAGGASALDIERLIDFVRDTVEQVHGIRLQPEVRVIGEAE
ncbi:MAG: UDP-N-acetylmuramate dehydrogenase [Gammaproteobacteria bacterium]|jgi:UDP-N-acetylmuramate dehydrogenase|nr:MAG: UDP-N-acetylenolpyruvoylglucosamine reductase [Gammaproteobacteria bacterium SG8_31]